jgi:hypothetical protein
MPALSGVELQAIAAVMVAVIIAKFTRSETRTLLAVVAVVVMVPSPAAVVAVAVLSLLFKGFDAIRAVV